MIRWSAVRIMGKLQGKVAVITGGTTGIGLASAKLFVQEGAYVFITGRRQKELDEAVKAIGSDVTGVQGDVAKLSDLDRLYETIGKKGRLDIVFANAGLGEFSPLGSITEEFFRQTVRHQREGSGLYGAKGLAALERWGFHHSHWLDRERQRHPRILGVRGDQVRHPQFRPSLDFGAEGPSYALQCPQPGSDRNAACRSATSGRHREDGVQYPNGPHGSPR